MSSSAATQIYYWPRSFLLRSFRFEQVRQYQRASVTLIVAASGGFGITTQGLGETQCSGVLLGPSSRRQGLRIAGADMREAVWILDVAPGTLQHRGLLDVLQRRPEARLSSAQLGRLQPLFAAQAEQPVLPPAQAQALHAQAVDALLPERASRPLDPRVVQVLQMLGERCLDEIEISELAASVELSESRLRSLVRRELASNLVQVSRWSAAWQTMLHWQPGMTLTDAAHAAGFHDLPHANRTANQMFGLSPSRALDSERVLLVPCAEPIAP